MGSVSYLIERRTRRNGRMWNRCRLGGKCFDVDLIERRTMSIGLKW